MPQITIAFGALLSLVGVGFYAATGAASLTPLIPSLIGLLLVLAGLLAGRPGLRRHAMHAAALVGTLGALGTLPGLLKLPALVGGGVVARPLAVVEQALTAVLCVAFVALCVRSFVNARRAQKA